ncbi:quaternary amine ABC transporter ATP-binding protein [Phaeobacter inhibens]|uniref:quaternary amine ABC transporter ATP-binding protein n=1 Tax=Phaeobacter inhibens TaxID=221822 RepID=UPI0001632A3D|nr:putative glycine betaine/L-proline transport system, ATP binding subunit [Phaeobacter inhibens DSM 17395]AUQ46926.1 putative glycine betaine/L-proline transport system, ATP binding subunit [Phaeobacter inhibens]
MNTTKIQIRNLYKIFGANPGTVLPMVRNQGMGKSQLLEEHKHVLGLQDISIDIQAGEISVIMGLSGSGKSTLIRHLNRLIEPTAGEILLDGQDVMDLDPVQLREMRQRSMSMVFQKFALLPHKTVLENAETALRVRGDDRATCEAAARKWLDRVGLSGFENRYPSQLSGGMQQRVGIARALTADTDIMLLDEAFSALDPLIRTDMQDLLLELQTELHKTIVFITHDLDEALKLADHLVILKDGAVVQQGPPQGIVMNPADPYIEAFVGDINRARVLRAGTIAVTGEPEGRLAGEVDWQDTLETVIKKAGGRADVSVSVLRDGQVAGKIEMSELMLALVPYDSQTNNSSGF